jgi:hypothetical protein
MHAFAAAIHPIAAQTGEAAGFFLRPGDDQRDERLAVTQA